MKNYSQFILEHKFWGKSIPEFLDWIKQKEDRYFVLLDTETTGLPSDPYEIQLTQISCIVSKYNFDENSFEEIETFDKKLKLSDTSLELMKKPGTRIKNVLSFNHYGKRGIQFHDEGETLEHFFEFLEKFDDPILVIQNAEFDMRFLNTRNRGVKFTNEVIDTKQIAQLFFLPCLQKLAETDQEFQQMVQRIGTSSRDSGLISSSLSKLGPALGIDMVGYHDALVDCRLMAEMFKKMIEFLKEHQDVDIKKYQAQRIAIIK